MPKLPSDKDAAFATFSASYNAYAASFGKTPGLAEAAALLVTDAMVSSVDEQHTNLVFGLFGGASSGASGQSYGLGLLTSPDPPFYVTEVAPDGPAQSAGLQPGDTILAVNGAGVTGSAKTLRKALTSSLAGAAVTLSMQRGGQKLQITLKPGGYTFPPFTSRLLAGGAGYLRLNEFERSSGVQDNGLQFAADLDRRLDEFDTKHVSGIVLDLRGNGGGDIETAAQLLGRFLPDDTRTVYAFDSAGHQTVGIVAAAMRRTQLPLAVLVDGGSASASELTASVLKENNRAVVVGTRTMGALALARMLPVTQITELEVAIAGIRDMHGDAIDGVGVPVDVGVEDTRTADDYRSGNDPQLIAAVQALAPAPPPPAYRAPSPRAAAEQAHNLLTGYMPQLDTFALLDGTPAQAQRLDSRDITDANVVAGDHAADPAALVQTLHDRGWLGRHTETFAVQAGADEREELVTVDAYATPAGASAALHSNDFPLEQQAVPAPQMADGAVAYAGVWTENGWTAVSWQRGNIIATVTDVATPGTASAAASTAVAKQVDALLQRYPTSGQTFQRQVSAMVASEQPAAVAVATQPPRPSASSSDHALPDATPHGGAGLPHAVSPTLIILLGFVAAFAVAARYARRGS